MTDRNTTVAGVKRYIWRREVGAFDIERNFLSARRILNDAEEKLTLVEDELQTAKDLDIQLLCLALDQVLRDEATQSTSSISRSQVNIEKIEFRRQIALQQLEIAKDQLLAATAELERVTRPTKEKLDPSRPIWRLPQELWSLIFEQAIETPYPPGDSKQEFPSLLITSICRLWRFIALSSPSLWRTIHYSTAETFSIFDYKAEARVSHYIKYSTKKAVRLIIQSFHYLFDYEQIDFLHDTINKLPYLEEVSYVCNIPGMDYVNQSLREFPPCKFIRCFGQIDPKSDLPRILIPKVQNTVQRLSLHEVHFTFATVLPYVHEIAFSISRSRLIMEVGTDLAFLPNLEKLTMDTSLEQFGQLSAISINAQPTPSFVMYKLHTIRSDIEGITKLFNENISTPSLAYIHIMNDYVSSLSDWSEFLSQNVWPGTFQTLTIDDDLDKETIQKLVPYMNRLRSTPNPRVFICYK